MFVALILLANIKIMFELIAILPPNICSYERIARGRNVEAGVRPLRTDAAFSLAAVFCKRL